MDGAVETHCAVTINAVEKKSTVVFASSITDMSHDGEMRIHTFISNEIPTHSSF